MPNTEVKTTVIEVVAGVILRQDTVLIARRPDHLHMGGLWEFPGGKREAGESIFNALQRELHEELGIYIREESPLMTIRHDYPDKQVLIEFRYVTAFDGEPVGRENQCVRWVPCQVLDEYAFPEANNPVVSALMQRDGN